MKSVLDDFEIKTLCDYCEKPWSEGDLRDPHGIIRLSPVEGTEDVRNGEVGRAWVIVGFGSGKGTFFVHRACWEFLKMKGERLDGQDD